MRGSARSLPERVALRADDEHVATRDARPLGESAERIEEVLDHVRADDEVDAAVADREPVARRDDVDGHDLAALTPLLAGVDLRSRVAVAELIDVPGRQAERVVRGTPDLDADKSIETAMGEGGVRELHDSTTRTACPPRRFRRMLRRAPGG